LKAVAVSGGGGSHSNNNTYFLRNRT